MIQKIGDLCNVFEYYTYKCIIRSNKNDLSLKKTDDNINKSKMNGYYLQSIVKYIDSEIKLLNDLHQWFAHQINKINKSRNMNKQYKSSRNKILNYIQIENLQMIAMYASKYYWRF